MRLFSKDDKSLIDMISKNKIATSLFVAWIIKYFLHDNSDPKTLEVIADFLLLTDSSDIGKFDHLHHWITGYIMKSLSQAKHLPANKRKAKIIKDLSDLSNHRKRLRFIRSSKVN